MEDKSKASKDEKAGEKVQGRSVIGGVPIQYPMLNETNYGLWAVKMRIILKALGVWEGIEGEGQPDKDKDQGAFAAISQSVPDSVVMAIADKETAKEAWLTIQQLAVGEERVRKSKATVLQRQFDRLTMSEAATVMEFSQELISLAGEIKSLGGVMTDAKVVDRLFSAVPDKFLPIISTIEQWGDTSTMAATEAVGRLRVFEESMKGRQQQKEDGGEKLLLTRAQWEALHLKEKEAGEGPSGKHSYGKEKVQKFHKKFDKSKIKCFNCGIYGHFASECRKQKGEKVLVVEKDEDDEPALLMHEVVSTKASWVSDKTGDQAEELHMSASVEEKKKTWFLDSGASNHMTGQIGYFTKLDKTVEGFVKLGDSSIVSIGGRGNVMVKGRTGERREISDVYYIPQLTSNIISLGQLEEKGYKVQIGDGWLRVLDRNNRLIIQAERAKNRLYTINLDMAQDVCLKATAEADTWRWHARYGHINMQSLRKMCQEGLVEGLPRIECINEVCRGCTIGKQRRVPFPHETEFRADGVLELLHGDLCGPITPQTPAGNSYFLLLVDDHSRFMWIVLIKTKDRAFSAFKEVKEAVELEKNVRVKALRTDRGGEFKSTEFADYCREMGIKRYFTAPYSPQQNGVVERRNQTVLSMARSMMKSLNVPSQFWGESVTTAVYILNRSVTKSLEGMTPYEAWYRRKPRVQHFRTFGCLVHVKVTQPHLAKLEDRSVMMVFFGYERGSKAYRVYNPISGKIHVTRDAIFEEDKGWNWEVKETSANTVNSTLHDFIVSYENGEEGGESSMAQMEPGYDDESAWDQSPSLSTHTPGSVGSESDGNQSDTHGTPLRFRSLDEIYSETEPVQLNLADMCLIGVEEPVNFVEASKDGNWMRAMDEELKSIVDNETWTLVEPIPGHKIVGLKWVYKLKKDSEGKIVKHKARVVAKGFVQQQGVDFDEVFAPVTRMETVRMIMAIAVQHGWYLHHMDVKSAFLNGELNEEVYVTQPPGYEVKGKEHMVLKLHKALYGLKQAPRAWNFKLDKTLQSMEFERRQLEHAVYRRKQGREITIVGVYVDDLLITGTSELEIAKFKSEMKEKFRMSDLGLLTYYLGIEVHQEPDKITLCQEGFAQKILKDCGMDDCNSAQAPMEARLKLSKSDGSPPVDQRRYRSIVGSLRYLLNTRPDLAYSVGLVSRFMETPTTNHMGAVKHILRYVKGTTGMGCCYRRRPEERWSLVGYSDSDMAGDQDDRKSTTGVIFFIGSNPISWFSRKQKVVALSSCEAEYIAAASAACQGVWLQGLCTDLVDQEIQKMKLRIDNKSAISLCKNPVYHDRSKHIDTRYHFIRECVESGKVEIEHIGTSDQLADILTKPLGRLKFMEMRERLGIQNVKGSTSSLEGRM